MPFDLHIGINYSGRETPFSRTSALQVYASFEGQKPRQITTPASADKAPKNWCRSEIAEWIIAQAHSKIRFIAGIDHGFSFPAEYFQCHGLKSWFDFLSDFNNHWRRDVEFDQIDDAARSDLGYPPREGAGETFRLTEKWTSNTKGFFRFDGQGSVAKATHAGLPWLRHIREKTGDKIHVWPFDGWKIPPGKSVLAEVFPPILRNRYDIEGRSADQHDAYCIAQWLAQTDYNGFLGRYLDPPLIPNQRKTAELEGWILGIM